MLDTKRILQLGIGVAVGMIAWHFIQKHMNKSVREGGMAGAFGRFGNVRGAGCTCANGVSGYCASGDCKKCCGEYGYNER